MSFFPDRVDETGFFQFLDETRVDDVVGIESFGSRVTRLQGFEHELDAFHVHVRNPVLKARNDLVSRIEHAGVTVLRKVGRNFQDKLSVVL